MFGLSEGRVDEVSTPASILHLFERRGGRI